MEVAPIRLTGFSGNGRYRGIKGERWIRFSARTVKRKGYPIFSIARPYCFFWVT